MIEKYGVDYNSESFYDRNHSFAEKYTNDRLKIIGKHLVEDYLYDSNSKEYERIKTFLNGWLN